MNLIPHLIRLVAVHIPFEGHQWVVVDCVKVGICIPPEANQRMVMLVLNQSVVVLVLNKVILVLNSLTVGKMLANHIEVAINLNIIFIQFVKICLHVFF